MRGESMRCVLRRAGAHAARFARRHGVARVVPGRAGPGVDHAHTTLDAVLIKARFWQRCAGLAMNERQVKVLHRLLDGFEGKLTTGKWAALAKCSQDTALRDVAELVAHGVLHRSSSGGRSTSCELVRFDG